ncbi:alpha/beta hydrolase [Amycolatopsis sp., V23-08]|uniref:Alpha/beta hydrolase n=1 Tax=Amycolatopsis heterodermiae TaxID=3110235 RepID=A0ABU5R8Y3_9PSEU|nr:alpha/beta hydrolase [Amycolatopsis sp., V23-08]MEA5362708.1 alpha/beta hydrolase [Amycolatopsis sp., V23-08]
MTRPTLLLVHGAWHGSWCWEPVQTLLVAHGWRVETVDLPSVAPDEDRPGLHDDARAVRAALDAIDGPVVVVAHSYGGAPVSEGAAGAPNVVHLVYVTAFQLDEGESLLGVVGGQPPSWWKVDGDLFTPLTPHEIFFADVDPDVAAKAIARLRPQSYAVASDQLTAAAWKTVPSTYVVCEDDNAIPVFAQEAMAGRAGHVERLPSSHSPFLSHPAELTAIVEAAAG